MSANGGRKLGKLSVLVADYDEAIAWYTGKLGCEVLEDTAIAPGKRWVVLGFPRGGSGILLARADGEAQRARIGDQTGGRVFLFLETDDFWRDHSAMTANGVSFREKPREEAYGTVAVFADLYGNLWDLIEERA